MNLHLLYSHRPSATLLVVLAACCLSPQSSQAQTQPPPQLPPRFILPPLPEIPAANTHVPLSADQQAAVTKALAFWEQAKICTIPISLKMTDATLDDVLARIKQEPTAKNLSVEVRDAKPMCLSFDLKQTSIGNVLDIVSGLAGSQFYLQQSGLLIAPKTKLSATEQQDIEQNNAGEWIDSNDGGRGKWRPWSPVSKVLFQAIAVDITGKPLDQLPMGVVTTTFDHFSPQSQQLLRTCADSFNHYDRYAMYNVLFDEVHLSDTSPVTVKIYAPDKLGISFSPASKPRAPQLFPGVPSGTTPQSPALPNP